MTGDHLDPRTRDRLCLPLQERLDRWQYIFVELPQAKEFAKIMRQLISRPDCERPYGYLLYGPSATGKSHALINFTEKERKAGVGITTKEHLRVPVLRVVMSPDTGAPFYSRVLQELSIKHRYRHPDDLCDRAVDAIQEANVRLLIIDEIHRASGGRDSVGSAFGIFVRDFIERIRRPVVIAGQEQAAIFLRHNRELQEVFHAVAVDPLDNDQVFESTLAVFEKAIPLQRPSSLRNKPLRERLFALSQGRIGRLSDLLREAATPAIVSGEERITLDILNATPVAQSLSKRLAKPRRLALPPPG